MYTQKIKRDLFEEEHILFRDMLIKFLENEVAPHHEHWEKQGQVDRAIWLKAGEQGFLCPQVPEEYGGVGVDFRYNAIVDEEIYRSGYTGLGWGLHSDIVVPYILDYGTEAQKQRYLPAMVTGELITAIAMTEPGTGSDLQNIKTTAIRQGDHYVINGSKTFITNGQLADMVIVVAKTDPSAGAKGTSLFLVDASTEGFSRGKNLEKIGMKAQDTSELFFQDMKVSADSLLGEEGAGFKYLMECLPQERLNVALNAVASCEGLLDKTIAYVHERTAFGKSVATFQNTQFKLAELETETLSARVFIDRCLELHLEGKLDATLAARIKLLSTDLNSKVADECLQLFGGYGYMWEYPVARAFADCRVQRIYAGTNEIMKLIIAREILAPQ